MRSSRSPPACPRLRRPRRDCLGACRHGRWGRRRGGSPNCARRRARRRSRSSRSSFRGLHARGDECEPRVRRQPDRRGQAQHQDLVSGGVRPLTGKSTASRGLPEDEGASPRGLPLSRHLRVHGGHHHAAARRPAARGVLAERAKIDMEYAESKNLTAYEVLIIASMIEEEVFVPKERPSSRGHPTACASGSRSGSTPRFATASTSRRRSRFTRASLSRTRRTTRGSSPVSFPRRSRTPGLAALQAAAHPANVDYLYYPEGRL